MNVCAEKDMAERPPREPLNVGDCAPNIAFASMRQETMTLAELRGQSVILVFAENDWNPARAEQMTTLTNALLNALDPDIAPSPPSSPTLHTVEREGAHYALRFDDQDALRLQVQEQNTDSEAARAFGVVGQQALFVLDGTGIIRWRHLLPSGTLPEIVPILAALQAMQPDAAPVKNVSALAHPGPASLWEGTRRDFAAAAFVGALALTLVGTNAESQQAAPQNAKSLPAPTGAETIPVRLTVNGKSRALQLDPRTTLLDALREHLNLTGSKKGCDHGQCGACTVHINGQRVLSCLSLAAQQEGTQIVTIEGLAHGEKLHPVQSAFIEHDGYQCGYCTSGQIMSAVALLREGHAGSDAEIREGMSGNLCRCAAYPHILAAVKAVRDSKQHV